MKPPKLSEITNQENQYKQIKKELKTTDPWKILRNIEQKRNYDEFPKEITKKGMKCYMTWTKPQSQ